MIQSSIPSLIALAPYGSDLWQDVQKWLGEKIGVFSVDADESFEWPTMARALLSDMPVRFSILAHCFGAYLAFEILRQAPHRVTGLALINSSARSGTPQQTEIRRQRIERLKVKAARRAFPDEEYVKHAAEWLLSPQSVRRLHVRERAESLLRQLSLKESLHQQQALLHRYDNRQYLSAIAVPTLIIGGAADRICPPALSDEMARLMPQAGLNILEGCGHLAPVEQPERVGFLLSEWLNQVRDCFSNERKGT